MNNIIKNNSYQHNRRIINHNKIDRNKRMKSLKKHNDHCENIIFSREISYRIMRNERTNAIGQEPFSAHRYLSDELLLLLLF